MSEEQTEYARAHSREVVLLRRFMAGERLPTAESAELAHLLSASVLANPPRARAAYTHELEHYAGKIGVAVRTLKRWISIGKDSQPRELPPLDDPPALLAWWNRMQARGILKQRPSQGLLHYGQPTARSAPSHPSLEQTGIKLEQAAPTAAPYTFSSTPGGLEESVEELRKTVWSTQERLRTAMLTGLDEGLISSLQRSVEKGLDLLRKAEVGIFEMQKKRGDLVPLKEVREDWSTLLMSQKMMRARMVDNVCSALAGDLSPAHLELVRSAVALERTREEQLLRGAKHWKEAADVSPVTAPA